METKEKKAEPLNDLMNTGKYKLMGEPFKMKMSTKNVLEKVTERGYIGKIGKNFVCDSSKEEATVFQRINSKYSKPKEGYYTFGIMDGKKIPKYWLDYHIGTGNGELFPESHTFFEFDIAIWKIKERSLFALAGKKIAIPVRGTKDSNIIFVSEDPRLPIFYIEEEQQSV